MIVSEYNTDPPKEDWDGARQDVKGPLYDPQRVVNLALAQLESSANIVVLWTKKAIRDAQNLHGSSTEECETDAHYVATLLSELIRHGEYLNSEWCRGQGVTIAACDAYKLCRFEYCNNTGNRLRYEYYLKFAIGISGAVILSVSNHL